MPPILEKLQSFLMGACTVMCVLHVALAVVFISQHDYHAAFIVYYLAVGFVYMRWCISPM